MRPARLRFPKEARLRKRPCFLHMNQCAKRLQSRHLVILWTENQLPLDRLGITITRKVANAVGRNLFKRRIREAFRMAGERLRGGVDLVVIAKRGFQQADYHSTAAELYQLLDKISELRVSQKVFRAGRRPY